MNPPQLMAFDNCDGQRDVDIDEQPIPATSSDPDNLKYTIVRTWTATDESGNSVTAQSTLFVVDDVAPVYVSDMDDTNLNCIFEVPEPYDTPVILDACDTAPSVSCEVTVLSGDDCHSEYERQCTAQDDAGNTNSVTQVITVKDDIAPTVQETEFCIQQQYGMMATFNLNDLVLQRFNPHDNCGGDVQFEIQSKSSELSLSDGQLTVPLEYPADTDHLSMTLRLTDSCGNFMDQVVELVLRSSGAGDCFVPLSVNTYVNTN
jgi:hypothetical protein